MVSSSTGLHMSVGTLPFLRPNRNPTSTPASLLRQTAPPKPEVRVTRDEHYNGGKTQLWQSLCYCSVLGLIMAVWALKEAHLFHHLLNRNISLKLLREQQRQQSFSRSHTHIRSCILYVYRICNLKRQIITDPPK